MDESLLRSLREVFETVSRMEHLADGYSEVPYDELAKLAFVVHDARLELNRLFRDELTQAQRKALGDFSHRLDATARDQLSSQLLPQKAKEALAAFGWD
jgi:hypothetical protein